MVDGQAVGILHREDQPDLKGDGYLMNRLCEKETMQA